MANSPPPRGTAEPLAKALDQTLAHMMDVKIANFDRAFTQMQSRLVRNRGTLEKLKARMENEALNSPELDREIIGVPHRTFELRGPRNRPQTNRES
jgi:hypothetical protein